VLFDELGIACSLRVRCALLRVGGFCLFNHQITKSPFTYWIAGFADWKTKGLTKGLEGYLIVRLF
jgi:hypothetical protein